MNNVQRDFISPLRILIVNLNISMLLRLANELHVIDFTSHSVITADFISYNLYRAKVNVSSNSTCNCHFRFEKFRFT